MAQLELNEQEQLNQQKASLLDDLMSVATVMEEVWNYHPDNPNKKDIVTEYNHLLKIQSDVENELKELETQINANN
jgi:hypothetical protein